MLAPTCRRSLAGILVSGLVLVGLAVPHASHAQTAAACSDPRGDTPETFGPTDISATTGNQSLSVALNPEGTVTVFKWPSPSFYDQIKYRTTTRSEPLMGALQNEGAFLGIAWHEAGANSEQWGFDWLRDWTPKQRFADDDGDEVVTSFTRRQLGLTVMVRDLVISGTDALLRDVKVTRSGASKVRKARVIAFSNFNPAFSKSDQSPYDDWCEEEGNDDGASYDKKLDAVFQERSGTDESTGDPSSVSIAMGFVGDSNGHQVGPDTYGGASDGLSAYDDSGDGDLSGEASSTGATDVALFDEVGLTTRRTGSTQFIIAAGADKEGSADALALARSRSAASWRNSKVSWWKSWLRSAPLPREAPDSVVRLAKRSLISLRQAIDANTSETITEGVPLAPGGLMVASIATQSPYGLDWIRNGAYLNYALGLIRHSDVVKNHNFRYGVLQHKTGDLTRGGSATIPAGNWHQNHYADGVVGGPITYEIDETGFGIWTLWEHYEVTGDQNYLFSEPVYESIQRAALYLTDTCRDLTNNLQCRANEGDNDGLTQGLRGAALVWLGLDSAIKAANEKDTDASAQNAEQWTNRRDEINQAIRGNFLDAECNCFTTDFELGGRLLWPVGFLSSKADDELEQAQAEVNWKGVKDSFNGKRTQGGFESHALLGNAHAWAGQPEKMALVRKGLRWVAEVATTNRTGLLGEAWMNYPKEKSPVVTMLSQPDVPEQIVFYLAALKAYGRTGYSFR